MPVGVAGTIPCAVESRGGDVTGDHPRSPPLPTMDMGWWAGEERWFSLFRVHHTIIVDTYRSEPLLRSRVDFTFVPVVVSLRCSPPSLRCLFYRRNG